MDPAHVRSPDAEVVVRARRKTLFKPGKRTGKRLGLAQAEESDRQVGERGIRDALSLGPGRPLVTVWRYDLLGCVQGLPALKGFLPPVPILAQVVCAYFDYTDHRPMTGVSEV
jgi:hypothetical protein